MLLSLQLWYYSIWDVISARFASCVHLPRILKDDSSGTIFKQLNAALGLFMSVIKPTLNRNLHPEMSGKQVMPNQNYREDLTIS